MQDWKFEGRPWLFRLNLRRLLGFWPWRLRYYKQALTHKSVALTDPQGQQHYERLEFLGDAVLELIVSTELFHQHPQAGEGKLSQWRSVLVRRSRLQHIALSLGLEGIILADIRGRSSLKNTHIPGDVLEALIGAIYLDRGLSAARHFYFRRLHRNIEDIGADIPADHDNYKGRLIQWAQKNGRNLEFLEGNDPPIHDRSTTSSFHCVAVWLDGCFWAQDRGASKKQAAQGAARKTLIMLNKDTL